MRLTVCAGTRLLHYFSIFIFAVHIALGQEDPRNHIVEIAARAETPPAMTLSWRGNVDAANYEIARRERPDAGWSVVANLEGTATSWRDTGVSGGKAYEYRIIKRTSKTYTGFGYVSAGINVPAMEGRGKLILVVERNAESGLQPELERLTSDLSGDGWEVVRVTVGAEDSPRSVREKIAELYRQDIERTKAVFLIGHVPVPYSGNIAPDGHENHRGAWPADVFYGEMNGNWTDSEVNSEAAERESNRNRPGDGKFDQSKIPTSVELAVGRVDFWNMTSFANKNPSRSELDLLRQYFAKNHEFRHGRIQVERRGLILDNFGLRGTNAVSGSGWRNFTAFFGLERVSQMALDSYFPRLRDESALFSWGAGGGSYYYSSGIGTSDDFALNDVRVIFTLWLGSYYGDWNNESNFLRAALGSGSILTSMFSGLPQSFLHQMALGGTIGEGLLMSQNNKNEDSYSPDGQGVNEVHISLLGDPTLRLHPVLPASALSADSGDGVRLRWNGSSDQNIRGYHIYRSPVAPQMFVRINEAPVVTTEYLDRVGAGDFVYMVRAIKLEETGSGTYFNLSQGVSVRGSSSGSTPQLPNAPGNFAGNALGDALIEVRWTDNSENEDGFQIERRLEDRDVFTEIATVGSQMTSFSDSTVLPGTSYGYRVRSYNAAGVSAYSNEIVIRTGLPPEPSATVTFAGRDENIQGNWDQAFGAQGSFVATLEDGLSSGLSAQIVRGATYLWESPSSDRRALLRRPFRPERIATAWFDIEQVEFKITAENAVKLAVYFVDWDRSGRVQRVEMFDTGTSVRLDDQHLEEFGDGVYLRYEIHGEITLRITRIAGPNGVVSGLFAGEKPLNSVGTSVTLQLTRTASDFRLQVSGEPGTEFELQSSDDFVTWGSAGNHQLSGPEFILTVPVGESQKYFRGQSR